MIPADPVPKTAREHTTTTVCRRRPRRPHPHPVAPAPSPPLSLHLWPTALCPLSTVTLFSPRSSPSTGCSDAPFHEVLHAIVSWMKMVCFDSCADSYSFFFHMLSLEGANGPLVTFSICSFEHPFHGLIRSQSTAAVVEEKKSEELYGSERMALGRLARCRCVPLSCYWPA